MNKGTKVRTALRVAVSIYSAFCVWQVAIAELSKQLHAPWLVVLCAVIIVLSGLAVDALTTYYNQDFTEEGAAGTAITREMKALRDYESETVEEPEDSFIEEEGDEYGEE